MNTSDQHLIERYYSSRLDAQERQEFQRRLQTDAAFAAEVELHGLALQAISMEAEHRLRERLAQKGKELDAENRRGPKPLIGRLGIALFVVVIAMGIAGIWFFNRYRYPDQAPGTVPAETEQNLLQPEQILLPSGAPDSVVPPVVQASVSAEDLFAAWFRPYRDDSIESATRGEGAGDPTPEETFYQLYWDARYAAAIAAFERLEPESKAKGDLRFLKANCLLAEKKTASAIKILEAPGRTRFADEARWLLALAYLRNGQRAQAATLLSNIAGDAASPKRKSAARLLAKLE